MRKKLDNLFNSAVNKLTLMATLITIIGAFTNENYFISHWHIIFVAILWIGFIWYAATLFDNEIKKSKDEILLEISDLKINEIAPLKLSIEIAEFLNRHRAKAIYMEFDKLKGNRDLSNLSQEERSNKMDEEASIGDTVAEKLLNEKTALHDFLVFKKQITSENAIDIVNEFIKD